MVLSLRAMHSCHGGFPISTSNLSSIQQLISKLQQQVEDLVASNKRQRIEIATIQQIFDTFTDSENADQETKNPEKESQQQRIQDEEGESKFNFRTQQQQEEESVPENSDQAEKIPLKGSTTVSIVTEHQQTIQHSTNSQQQQEDSNPATIQIQIHKQQFLNKNLAIHEDLTQFRQFSAEILDQSTIVLADEQTKDEESELITDPIAIVTHSVDTTPRGGYGDFGEEEVVAAAPGGMASAPPPSLISIEQENTVLAAAVSSSSITSSATEAREQNEDDARSSAADGASAEGKAVVPTEITKVNPLDLNGGDKRRCVSPIVAKLLSLRAFHGRRNSISYVRRYRRWILLAYSHRTVLECSRNSRKSKISGD